MTNDKTMKAAWVGVIAAILASVLTIIGTPYVQKWFEAPNEGLFSVDVNTITAADVDPYLRSQINRYPCVLKVKHISGPTIEDITINIDADKPLDSLRPLRTDDSAVVRLSPNRQQLRLDIATLRKGSLVQLNFTSLGSPNLSKNIIVKSGKSLEEQPSTKDEPFYTNENFLIGVLIVVGVIIFIIILAPFFKLLFSKNAAQPIPSRQIKQLSVLVAILSLTPFLNWLATVYIILLLTAIYLRSD